MQGGSHSSAKSRKEGTRTIIGSKRNRGAEHDEHGRLYKKKKKMEMPADLKCLTNAPDDRKRVRVIRKLPCYAV